MSWPSLAGEDGVRLDLEAISEGLKGSFVPLATAQQPLAPLNAMKDGSGIVLKITCVSTAPGY